MNGRRKRLVMCPKFKSFFYHFLNVHIVSVLLSTSVHQGWTTASVFQGIKGHTDQGGPNLTKQRGREPHSFTPAWISRVPDFTLFLNKNLQVTDHRVSNASRLPALALPSSWASWDGWSPGSMHRSHRLWGTKQQESKEAHFKSGFKSGMKTNPFS